MDRESLSREIKAKAAELGFDLCGIIKAEALTEFADALRARIELYPDSKELYEDLFFLADPLGQAPWAESIVVCVRDYSKYALPEGLDANIGKLYIFDRRIRGSPEYEQDIAFEAFLAGKGMRTHKGDVAARPAAVKAGLASFGNNNFLHTRFGSFVSVDTWMVDAELETDGPREGLSACPPSCRRCVDACPTKALSAPHKMDMGKCVAQLSYYPDELYGDELVPEELRESMGPWIYGCDACQNACPKNKKWAGTVPFPQIGGFEKLITLESILTMDEETFLRDLYPRFNYIGKHMSWLWKCNALRAMANSGEDRYRPYLRAALRDPHGKVREMAKWACGRLGISA